MPLCLCVCVCARAFVLVCVFPSVFVCVCVRVCVWHYGEEELLRQMVNIDSVCVEGGLSNDKTNSSHTFCTHMNTSTQNSANPERQNLLSQNTEQNRTCSHRTQNRTSETAQSLLNFLLLMKLFKARQISLLFSTN